MKIFHFISILITFTTALPITFHSGFEKRTGGTEFYSPIFTAPSTYNAGSGGLDGASTPPIPSAPWPFGKGTTAPTNPGWKAEAPGTKYSVANLPTFGPHGVLDMADKPASPAKPVTSSAWAPLGLVGDLVNAMKPKVEEPYLVKHVNGGVNDGRAVELARLAVAGEEEVSAVASDICPTCGRGPSGWDKVVKWFKGAWNSVKGVFKKKDKQD